MFKFTEMNEVSNAPISTSLLANLQRDILTGRLKPGQKIVEQELCNEYGVSRTPIREALRQLEADGLVENILNRGAFVIGMSDQDYEDMFDMKRPMRFRLWSGQFSVSPKRRWRGWRKPLSSWNSTP